MQFPIILYKKRYDLRHTVFVYSTLLSYLNPFIKIIRSSQRLFHHSRFSLDYRMDGFLCQKYE